MTSRDCLSFNVIASSQDIKSGLQARKFENIPANPNSVKSMVMKFGEKVRDNLKVELCKLKEKGERFSLTFDEWTSNGNKRYLNINVHSENDFHNLGLCRVNGSLPAEACLKLVEKK